MATLIPTPTPAGNAQVQNETPVLIITDAAAQKIQELLIEEGDPNLHLRISIKGGGCSGFKYEFSFDDSVTDDDIVVKKKWPIINDATAGEVAIVVDMLSIAYLQGATIDYKNDANGERFVIVNPNAKTTCGCGSSFDT